MRTLGLTLLAAWTLACGRGTPRPAVEDTDTSRGAVAEVSCGLLPTIANPDPFDLVREYVQRDGNGELAATGNRWLDTALACPRQARRPDTVTIVAGYSFRALAQDAERARMLATYILVGDVRESDSSVVLERRVGTERDTFVVTRTAFGWRIEARPSRRMVLVEPAMAVLGTRLLEADRQLLAGIAARRRVN